MSALLNLISTFNVTPIKILGSYFVVFNKMIIKFIWKGNNIKWEQNQRIDTIQVEEYCKALVIKTVWWKNMHTSIESPQIDPHNNSQLISDKGSKAIQWRKDHIFNKWCWKNWTFTCKKTYLDTDLTPFTKFNSKWILNLNVKHKHIKLQKTTKEKNQNDFRFGDDLQQQKHNPWKKKN